MAKMKDKLTSDFPNIQDVLQTLHDAGVIAWPTALRGEETNKALYRLDVDLDSIVYPKGPTCDAAEIREHEDHERDRQI